MPKVKSECSSMFRLSSGAQKLGQPVPDSNLVSELKSRSAAADAAIQALVVKVPGGAGERPFGRGVTRDLELDRRQLTAPFGRRS